MIGCEHWQDCGVAGGGCCEADIYRRPSFGVCTQCPVNTSNPSPLTVDEYLAERDRDAGAARDKPRSPSLLSKVVSYAKAEASMILSGPLPDVAYDARMRVCQKCEHTWSSPTMILDTVRSADVATVAAPP